MSATDGMDYYDVQNMIRDELTRARAEWRESINAAREELRCELDDLSRDLRRLITETAGAGRA